MIKKFKKPLIQLKPSKIIKSGVGVFAVRDLKKGTLIGDVELLNEDLFFTWSYYKTLDKESKILVKHFCVATPKGFYAPKDINYLSIPWYINHSCGGNVGYDFVGNFITIKNIRKGEELCYDYGLAASYSGFRLKCRCGSKKCRKIITGNDWRNLEYRKKHYIYMTPEIKELIKIEG